MLGWLPIVGPIIDGIVSIVKGSQDTKVKIDTNNLEEVKARLEVIKVMKDDPGTRLCRDLIMFPVAVWCALASWDTIVAVNWPWLRFLVAEFPKGPLEYLPFAVLGYLFGLAIRSKFK